MQQRKSFAVLFATVLCLGSILGCSTGGSSEEPAPAETPPASETPAAETPAAEAPEEPLKLKVTLTTGNSGHVVNSPDINEDRYVKKLEELSNTDLEFELLPHENYEQSLSLTLAGGELPDILQTKGINTAEVAPAVDAGVLLPLNDLIDRHAPNLKAKVKPDSWKSGRVAKDGVIYGIPGDNAITNGTVVYIRKDWLDKLNLQVPKTVEEYIEVLRAFRDGDPNGNGKKDEIPFSGREKFSHTGHFFGAFDVPLNAWRLVDGKLTPNHVRPEMKDALAIYRQLYEEKLLDNEFITQPGNVWDNKIVTGQVGMWAHAATYPDTWLNRLRENVPEADIALIPAPVGPSGKPGGVYAIGSSVSDFVWTIPKGTDEAKAIEIIKFFDWFYSDEAPSDFFLYGLEGEDHTKSGDAIAYNYPSVKEDYDAEAMHQEWLHFTGPKLHLTDETFIKGRNMGELIFSGIQTGMNEGIVNDGLDIPTLPALQARPELDHNGLFQEIAAKIITGQEPVEAFDAYVADWKSRGGDQWITEATEWYNNR
jgi:putative aldouronate transport system substrate-binding protein